MHRDISAVREQSGSHHSLNASLVKLNEAYSNNQLGSYKALGLKDSYSETTSCNVQWGPMMRA
jgi:hypothetical protein